MKTQRYLIVFSIVSSLAIKAMDKKVSSWVPKEETSEQKLAREVYLARAKRDSMYFLRQRELGRQFRFETPPEFERVASWTNPQSHRSLLRKFLGKAYVERREKDVTYGASLSYEDAISLLQRYQHDVCGSEVYDTALQAAKAYISYEDAKDLLGGCKPPVSDLLVYDVASEVYIASGDTSPYVAKERAIQEIYSSRILSPMNVLQKARRILLNAFCLSEKERNKAIGKIDYLLKHYQEATEVTCSLQKSSELSTNCLHYSVFYFFALWNVNVGLKFFIELGKRPDWRSVTECVRNSNIENARLLIAAGAPVQDLNNELGWQPLFVALLKNDERMANLLVESGACLSARFSQQSLGKMSYREYFAPRKEDVSSDGEVTSVGEIMRKSLALLDKLEAKQEERRKKEEGMIRKFYALLDELAAKQEEHREKLKEKRREQQMEDMELESK